MDRSPGWLCWLDAERGEESQVQVLIVLAKLQKGFNRCNLVSPGQEVAGAEAGGLLGSLPI